MKAATLVSLCYLIGYSPDLLGIRMTLRSGLSTAVCSYYVTGAVTQNMAKERKDMFSQSMMTPLLTPTNIVLHFAAEPLQSLSQNAHSASHKSTSIPCCWHAVYLGIDIRRDHELATFDGTGYISLSAQAALEFTAGTGSNVSDGGPWLSREAREKGRLTRSL